MLRIGSDLDGVLFDFDNGYISRFKKWPKKDYVITRNVERILCKEKDFWLNLPILRYPDFTPTMYCTARVNPYEWTVEALQVNSFPSAPVVQVHGYKSSKVSSLKGKVDVFIDDSLKNFIDLNTHGIPCLLMDSPLNKQWGPIGRIFNLQYEHIRHAYYLFMETVFPKFSNLI